MDSNGSDTDQHIFLEGISPRLGAFLATTVATALSEGLNPSQINILANFIVSIADSMAYIAAQMEFNSEFCSNNSGQNNATTVQESEKGDGQPDSPETGDRSPGQKSADSVQENTAPEDDSQINGSGG